MSSITPSSKILIGHPTFSRSIESHGSAHSADASYQGWRRTGTLCSEDVGTQTELGGASGSISGSGRMLIGELRRRREDTIVDISLESMKYNGGNMIKERKKKTKKSHKFEKNKVFYLISLKLMTFMIFPWLMLLESLMKSMTDTLYF